MQPSNVPKHLEGVEEAEGSEECTPLRCCPFFSLGAPGISAENSVDGAYVGDKCSFM